MSSRVDSAIPTRLSSIRDELIGKKLRVVGKYVPNRATVHFSYICEAHITFLFPPPHLYRRVLSHDVRSSTILLWNDGHVVLVDISLCLPTKGSAPWLKESKSTVTLFGYLERSQVTIPCTRPQGRLTKFGCHRVPTRPKCACRTFIERSSKTWFSFRVFRCRRSSLSIPRT